MGTESTDQEFWYRVLSSDDEVVREDSVMCNKSARVKSLRDAVHTKEKLEGLASEFRVMVDRTDGNHDKIPIQQSLQSLIAKYGDDLVFLIFMPPAAAAFPKPLDAIERAEYERFKAASVALNINDPVVKFWAALCKKQLTEDKEWISLPKGTWWMGIDTNREHLYTREVYRRFWDEISESHQDEISGNFWKSWVITGTPGIGKSFFGFFLFHQIHNLNKDATIIFMSPDNTYIFYPDGTVEGVAKRVAKVRRDILAVEQNWLIADAVLPPLGAVSCRRVVVTSPKLIGVHDLTKYLFKFRYMPIWTLNELELVREKVYPGMEVQQMENEFNVWGGVPRTVLYYTNAEDESWKSILEPAFIAVVIKRCMEIQGATQPAHLA